MLTLKRTPLSLAIASALSLIGSAASADPLVINDTLTGAASSYDWISFNGACLTAGDGSPSSIPACNGLAYYAGKIQVGGVSGRLPDSPGFGALRLSNGDTTTGGNGNFQTGSIVSNFTFPTNLGVKVTWTSVTYGGNKYKGTGADGITFFLSDGGTQSAPVPATIGANGGSLGYECQNGNSGSYDGVRGGYIGVGIDEFGNFSNKGDNTSTGEAVNGLYPSRISVRGAGSVRWDVLSTSPTLKKYYPNPLPARYSVEGAIHATCAAGVAINYSGLPQIDANGHLILDGNKTTEAIPDYAWLAHSDLPTGVKIYSQQAIPNPTRGAAVPITYDLLITPDGFLTFQYSYNGGATTTVINGLHITDTSLNGPLPASFRFGFSAGTGGGSNVHEITCFKAETANQSSSSAGTNVQKVQTGNQLYLGYYHPANWWGTLAAYGLVDTPATPSTPESLTIAPMASWDASCVLTGGTCETTGVATSAQQSTARTMLTWNPTTSAPVKFAYTSLSTTQQAAINGDSQGANRVAFLRGDRSNEANGLSTSLRQRTSVLGDIIDSSPTWVGAPSSPYSDAWGDKLYPSAAAPETGYDSFSSTYAARQNVVYVGANDGMLHGFRAGVFDAAGNWNGATNDGREVLAYVPSQAITAIHGYAPTQTPPFTAATDYSNPAYVHNFYVDATPGTGELFYNGAWHTWLVGGLGVGGHPQGAINDNSATIAPPVSSIFALDITNPANFSEAAPGNTVVGEWSSASLTSCSACATHFGQTLGTPVIRRLHDGSWGAIFGNGTNSAAGTAGIFVMHVAANGAVTFQYLDVPASGPANGIVQVTPVDLDADHVVDYVYAGDVKGNVWRFDLTSQSPGSWAAVATPLISVGKPITTKLVVGSTQVTASTGLPKIIVSFGTGQKLPQTLTSAEIFAPGSQSLYGVWDARMTAWNATATDTKYDSLPLNSSTGGPTSAWPVAVGALTTQTVTSTSATTRNVSENPVCWAGSTACGPTASANPSFGWTLALPGTNEQIVFNPITAYGEFIVNTMIPSVVQPLTCGNKPPSGFTMAVQIATGGPPDNSFLTNSSGQSQSNTTVTTGGVTTNTNLAGVAYNGTGSPSIVAGSTDVFLVQQTVTGGGSVSKVNVPSGTGSRLNWTQMR